MNGIFTMAAPCLLGLEGLAAQELREMGALQVAAQDGRVLFSGDSAMLARANLWSRYAERIQIYLGSFEAATYDALFEGVKALPWENWIGKNDRFPVKGHTLSSALRSVPDCQSIIKKAVVERLRGKYRVSWFEETGPLCQIQFLLRKDTVSLMIDSSGAGLHKRGYRANANEAPIRETLAAAMANLSRLRTDANMIDPFCGSGTILIESALYALGIAPGLRRKFVCETWNGVDSSVFETERSRALDLIRRDAAFHAKGYDIDPAALELARANAAKAGVAGKISVLQRDIRQWSENNEYGCVICNPPYGERMLDLEKARELYRVIGGAFEKKRGWNYTVISSDGDFETYFGRPADRRRKLYNGNLPCQVYMYYKY